MESLFSSRVFDLLGSSFLLSVLVGLFTSCTALGLGLFNFSKRASFWREIKWLVLFFAVIPPYVQAGFWLEIFHALHLPAQGLLPAAIVQTASILPLSILMILVGFESIPQQLIESGQLLGSTEKMIRKLIWPSIKPYVLSSMGISMVLSLLDFTVPTIFQFPVIGLEILENYAATAGLIQPLAKGLLFMVIALPICWFSFVVFLRKSNKYDSVIKRNITLKLPILFNGYRMLSLLLTLLFLLAPALVLMFSNGIWGQLVEVLESNGRLLLNSGIIAALAGLVAVVLSVIIVYSRVLKQRASWLFLLFVFCIPPPLLGTGIQLLFNQPLLEFIYLSPIVLVLVDVLRFGPIAVLILYAVYQGLPKGYFEQAKLIPSSQLKRVLLIDARLMAPGMITVFLIIFLLSLGEAGAGIAVIPPGVQTISIKIFNYLHYGAGDQVSALSLVIFLILIFIYFIHLLLRGLQSRKR